MLIVPKADALTEIAPQDIDLVRSGQTAVPRFSAFNQRRTPETTGDFTPGSADISQHRKRGPSFYMVRITPHAGDIVRLDGLKTGARHAQTFGHAGNADNRPNPCLASNDSARID